MKRIQCSIARVITTAALFVVITALTPTGALYADGTRSLEDMNSVAEGPNAIDTVYFTVSNDARNKRSKTIALQFWTRACTSCKLHGFVTPKTNMTTPLGESLPISLLRKGTEYKALAIVYSDSADGSIEQIILAESL